MSRTQKEGLVRMATTTEGTEQIYRGWRGYLFRIVLLLFLLGSSGCIDTSSPSRDMSTTNVLPEPTIAVTPAPDKAVVIGQVVDEQTDQPIPHATIRLLEVYRDEATGRAITSLDEALSPSEKSDENGYFVFENIPAREYTLAAKDQAEFGGNITFLLEEDKENTAKILLFESGTVTNLGVVRLENPF